MTEAEKEPYKIKAAEEDRAHKNRYPDYIYNPRDRNQADQVPVKPKSKRKRRMPVESQQIGTGALPVLQSPKSPPPIVQRHHPYAHFAPALEGFNPGFHFQSPHALMLDYGLSTPNTMAAGANDYNASNLEMERYSNFNSFAPSPAEVGPNTFFNNVMFPDVSPVVATPGYEHLHPLPTLPFPLFSSPAHVDQQSTYGDYYSPNGPSLTVSVLI